MLRQLNRNGQPEAVVGWFESGQLAASEAAVGEYVKALVRLDKLDNTRLLSTLQRGAVDAIGGGARGLGGLAAAARAAAADVSPAALAAAHAAPQAPWYAAAPPGPGGFAFPPAAAAALAGAGAATAGGALGTVKNPVVITHAEPSLLSQFARLVRSLGLAFIMVTAVGAFLDEKTLSKVSLFPSPVSMQYREHVWLGQRSVLGVRKQCKTDGGDPVL